MTEQNVALAEEKAKKNEERIIKKDRMRFAKNKLSANLTYLAILMDVLFFIAIFKSNDTAYYTIMIGVSVVYNLFFLLAGFLSAEGIKNYKTGYGVLLVVIGALQLARIFIYPVPMHSSGVMSDAKFVRCLVYLCSSAGIAIAAGVVGIVRSIRLKNYLMEIGKGQPA